MLIVSIAIIWAVQAASGSDIGIEMYRQRQFDAAEKELRRVLAQRPDDAQTRLYLARTLIEQQRIPEALAELELALEGEPQPETRFQAGRLMRDLAERRFADLERVAPDSAPLRELAGSRFEMKGQFAEALDRYQAAAALEPRRPGLQFLIGNVLWKMRELPASEKHLRAELAGTPHHALANMRLGQVLIARNEEELAIPYLEKAAKAMSDSIEVRRELGKAYRKVGRTDEARREWEAVAAAKPEDDQIHYLLGNLYREVDDRELAKRALERHRAILERRRALAEKR
ncbi:MAG: tetratricopeptide repeat protein [Bryobacteraceae bacterium]